MNSVEIWVNKEKLAWEEITFDSNSANSQSPAADVGCGTVENATLKNGSGPETKTVRSRAHVDLDASYQIDDCENGNGAEYRDSHRSHFWDLLSVGSFSWWSYGRMDTCLALALATFAFTLSLKAKGSTSFVTLDKTLTTKEDKFAPLAEMGLIFVKLCEVHFTEEQSLSRGKLPYRVAIPTIFEAGTPHGGVASSQCHVERWQHGTVDDSIWDASRVSSTISTWCGGIVVIWLLFGICFEGLNTRALAVVAVGAFWFEAMTFLIFGSDICVDQGCALSIGSKYAAAATGLWFIGSIAIFRMYLDQLRNFAQVEYRDTCTDKDVDACKPDTNKSKKHQFIKSSGAEKSKKNDFLDRTMTSTASMLFDDSRSATTVTTEEQNERDESVDILMDHHGRDYNRAYAMDLILEDESERDTDTLSIPAQF